MFRFFFDICQSGFIRRIIYAYMLCTYSLLTYLGTIFPKSFTIKNSTRQSLFIISSRYKKFVYFQWDKKACGWAIHFVTWNKYVFV